MRRSRYDAIKEHAVTDDEMKGEGAPSGNGGDALPRRGYVGLQVAPVAATGPEGPGLYVRSVAAGSAAERAGALPGDRLIAIAEHPVQDMNAARKHLRQLRAGSPLHVSVLRGNRSVGMQRVELHDTVRPFPVEQHEHGRIELGHVRVGSHRLRTVALVPDGPKPHPVLLYLPGAHWASQEYPFQPAHPVPRLLGEFARRGIASLRMERFGMGDSEGPPCNRVDFATEYAGYLAGLNALADAEWADPARVILLGHSLGAIVAPLLATDAAARFRPAGLLSFGASAIPISVSLLGALDRYARLSPGSAHPDAIAGVQELLREIVVGGKLPAQVIEQRPELARFKPEHFSDDSIYRRVATFYHQVEALPLADTWRQVRAPSLIVHGAQDWLCTDQDSQRIAALAPAGRFASVPNTDHQLADAQTNATPRLSTPLATLLTHWATERLRSHAGATAQSGSNT